MDQLFAPWRIEWVERDDDADGADCVFCELPERDDDRENRVVARSDHCFVLLNNFPYNPGHVMVIPYDHGGRYEELPHDVLVDHAKLKQRALRALRDGLDPDAFNTGLNLGSAAGGSISDHLHTHVVPRWNGDTNFMAVTADTTVIVEAVDDTYGHLHGAFATQAGATDHPGGAVRLDL